MNEFEEEKMLSYNTLIAGFMELKIIDGLCYSTSKDFCNSLGIPVKEETIPYHRSWNELMPVVTRIEQVHEGVPQELINLSLFSDQHDIYLAVVEFINEYNKNK